MPNPAEADDKERHSGLGHSGNEEALVVICVSATTQSCRQLLDLRLPD